MATLEAPLTFGQSKISKYDKNVLLFQKFFLEVKYLNIISVEVESNNFDDTVIMML